MKKILFISDINSSHTQKWITGVSSIGFETALFSLSSPDYDWYSKCGIKVFKDHFTVKKEIYNQHDLSKIKYYKFYKSFEKAIRLFAPDIVHAHYATSYGLLGALSGFHPFILSVWGSDVFDFPNRSLLHKSFLKWNLNKADLILSTSLVMKNEVLKYTGKPVEITPFGIDTEEYYNFHKKENEYFTIGIIKTLEKHYGIDNLIKAFKIVIEKYPHKKIRLMIVGNGSRMTEYKNLVAFLKLEDKVVFSGRIKREDVPVAHNKIDLFVNPSLSESFGVSVLEASACEVPVIVSNVGGLPEVVVNNQTGIILSSHSTKELADTISYFIDKPEQIALFGNNGRKFVKDNYEWKNNLKQISDIYKRF